MKTKEYILTSIKLFLLYMLLWAILSSFLFSYFSVIFLLVLSFVTPLVFKLHLDDFSFFKGLKLLGFFIYYSIKSGLLVALYVLKKQLDLQPILYEVPLKINSPFAISMLVNIYSLMPGTVSMGIENNRLILHILDKKLLDEEFIFYTQNRVKEVFEKDRS